MRAKACFVLGVLAAAAAAGLAVLPLRGPDPMAVPTVQQVFERTMSPFCPGLTVAECPSLQAGDMRERIAERVAGRWSNRRIDRWLVENYGEAALARPAGRLAWLAPAGALAAGIFIVGAALRHRQRPVEEPPPVLDPEEQRRVLHDLQRFSQGVTE